MKQYSIIIPAFNEEARLGATLEEIGNYLAASGRSSEILVVDDGSTDGTVELAKKYGAHLPVTVIESDRNYGKGHAVRIGMLQATGDFRIFTDADGSTPIDELDKLEAALDGVGGEGVAFASVAMPDSQILSHQSRLRSMAGRVGNRLIQWIALPGVADSQRGFKLFSADAAEAVFAASEVDGWAFDVEALVLARQAGCPTVEVGVRWEHRLASRVGAASYLSSLLEVIRIRRRLGKAPLGREGVATSVDSTWVSR